MDAFTIKDLENLSGIKAHTIRIWEQRYSLIKPQRTETNIRYYNSRELKKILNIALLAKYGYKISHINKMSEEEVRKSIFSLSTAEAQQDRIVNELIQCTVNVDLEKFEDILDSHILSKGIDKTIIQIVFPFLDRIGILWMTNNINPGEEHLITNIIRQKLIVGIESASSPILKNKAVLLFLPEEEHHEIGLLYVAYLLKKNGAKILYMGADVPIRDLKNICKVKKPDFLYAHLTCDFKIEKYFSELRTAIPDSQLIISGKLCQKFKNKAPDFIHVKRSLTEVMEFVSVL
ncbi:MAG: MerR family transcriptional regulator [Bacteroidetes bacterium]|nr:MerR family transcriptional regulator [Bacteroidota bacterium]MBS1973894.1 MerR family transcriptional regulator [Bacteroidota bacterium]